MLLYNVALLFIHLNVLVFCASLTIMMDVKVDSLNPSKEIFFPIMFYVSVVKLLV